MKLMLANADRSVTQLAVALFDLDHFKKVNDVFGHEKGDQLLAAVGDVAASATRASDFVARFGGEEFLVLLPNTDLPGAVLALREAARGHRGPARARRGSQPFGQHRRGRVPRRRHGRGDARARRRSSALRRQVVGTELRQGPANARRRKRGVRIDDRVGSGSVE